MWLFSCRLNGPIDVGAAKAVKRHPYQMNPNKSRIRYLLDNDIIEESQSEWSSPCVPYVVVPKKNGCFRLYQDFRKVNSLSKGDTYPNKRIDDCIEKVGKARYITTFDMLKGY
jgi:hypothetical protein